MTRLAIVGLGLIGGSLASAARERGAALHVTGVDVLDVIRSAAAEQVTDALVDVNDVTAFERALGDADVAVLAAPVGAICEQVARALAHAPVVTDCGSTKRRIVEQARTSPRRARFVPGHPMAGLPNGSLANATSALFVGSNWILCPETADADARLAVETLVLGVGANVLYLSPEQHDAAVARTSHVPQLLASALAIIGHGHAATGASGPAFQRATRTAGGAERMWRDIFTTNGDEVARALLELVAELEPVAAELERTAGAGTSAADALLARARRLRSGD